MKIHQRGCGSPTGLGDVLAPRPCCKALRESKAQLKTCLTRCFLMDLPEWVNSWQLAWKVLRSSRSDLRPLSGDTVLGGLPQRGGGVCKGRCLVGIRGTLRDGLVVKAVGHILGGGKLVTQCSRPSAVSPTHCLPCPAQTAELALSEPRLTGNSADTGKSRLSYHPAPLLTSSVTSSSLTLSSLVYNIYC